MIATKTGLGTVEMLAFRPETPRARSVMNALVSQAHPYARVRNTFQYQGGSDVLCLWGPGAPDRFEPMRRQLAAGRRVVCFDLAYWDRHQKFRVSIDAAHPQAWVMRRDWPRIRFENDQLYTGVAVADVWKTDGPVIVAGIGEKARVQYGDAVSAWERTMIDEARRRGRTVWYRPKKPDQPAPTGVLRAPTGPIESVLTGASLVCTWHSNVAVDAIRLGIPAICRDGAAAAVCPSTWTEDEPQPLSVSIRDRFLGNLAWFQWSTSEAAACWAWLAELLS